MNLLLSHGYFLSEDPKEQQIMRPYPPLGILSISAYLKAKGVDVHVFDTTFATMIGFQDYLVDHKPQSIGLYVNLMTKLNILKIIRFIRNHPDLKQMRIILGGPEVTHHKEQFLQHGADFIVLGEGETTMYDLLTTLDNAFNPFLDQIDGIAFLNIRGEMVVNKEREKLKNIDLLPMPDRKAIRLEKYFDAWKQHHGYATASINTMRGCPYTCKWCSRAVYGLSYRRRSPALVVEELAWVKKEYGVDTFWFVDDVFTVSHKWLREFSEALDQAGLKIRYECITRADRMNEEVVDLLAATGCFRVWIGAESGSQRILDAMDRRVDASQVQEMIQLAQAKGVAAGTFIMLGYPGETEADILATVEHLAAADPDLFTLTVAYPIKGTPLYTEVEPNMIRNLPWEAETDRDIDFQRTYPRAYYDHAVRFVYNEVYYRKAMKRRQYLLAGKHKLRSVLSRRKMTAIRSRDGK